MPELSRTELVAYAACALLIALLGWRALRSESPSAPVTATAAPATPTRTAAASSVTVQDAPAGPAIVDVVGQVRRPGVYRLQAGQRVQDAIRRAGGVRPGADLQAINLAAKIADAQQIVVPRRTPVAQAAPAGAGDPAATATGSGGPGGAGPPVNLNSATLEQLDTLDGVGPATAQKILQYRQDHGGFRSIDDLAQVSGIGPKRLEALRARVQV